MGEEIGVGEKTLPAYFFGWVERKGGESRLPGLLDPVVGGQFGAERNFTCLQEVVEGSPFFPNHRVEVLDQRPPQVRNHFLVELGEKGGVLLRGFVLVDFKSMEQEITKLGPGSGVLEHLPGQSRLLDLLAQVALLNQLVEPFVGKGIP